MRSSPISTPIAKLQLAREFMEIGERPLAVAQNDFAERCGRDALPVENRNTESILELLEAARQIGLRHAERLRRATEMTVLRESAHNLELANSRHVDALCVSNDIHVEIGPAKSMRVSV